MAVLLTGVLTACGSNSSGGDSSDGGGDKKITVGAKDYTAQFLLSKITTLYLEDNGFDVKEVNGMGSTALRKALENDQVDFSWEYTGTALVTYMKKDPIADPEKAFDKVKKVDKDNDLVWMNQSKINNTYALAMKKEDAKKLGIESISDLAAYVKDHPDKITIAMDSEFANRPDGIKGVEKQYDFKFGAKNIKQMKIGLQYKALDKGEVNAAMAFTTDPQIKKFDLAILKDDKNFFPAYYAAVSMRKDVYDKYPKLKDLTNDIAEKLSSDTMIDLNYKVDVEDKKVEDVAKKWLEDNDLLD